MQRPSQPLVENLCSFTERGIFMQTLQILDIFGQKREIKNNLTSTIISSLIVNSAEKAEAKGYLKYNEARNIRDNLEHSFRSSVAQIKNDNIEHQTYSLTEREDLARMLNDIIRLDITVGEVNFPEESEWL